MGYIETMGTMGTMRSDTDCSSKRSTEGSSKVQEPNARTIILTVVLRSKGAVQGEAPVVRRHLGKHMFDLTVVKANGAAHLLFCCAQISL